MVRICSAILAGAFVGLACAADTAGLKISQDRSSITIADGSGTEMLRYWLHPPEGVSLPVKSASFFHPLKTPAGVTITELAPADHPHHRGIFFGWVEMHGAADADFWGWGEAAPADERNIAVRKTSGLRAKGSRAAFGAESAWTAEGEVILVERLQAFFGARPEGNILDLHYRLTPPADTVLGGWAFGGFCVRTIREGKVTAHGPDGEVDFPDPSHLQPESDWPDAEWYAFSILLEDGKQVGVAVINHPENPPTLWHNHRQTRMLNPCLTAPAEVRLQKHKPLHLRYRVVAFDGSVPEELLNQLARNWATAP